MCKEQRDHFNIVCSLRFQIVGDMPVVACVSRDVLFKDECVNKDLRSKNVRVDSA